MTYVKIHRELISSSVWSEPDHVRIAWITMLALMDRDCLVHGSPRGLADQARMPVERFQGAIDVLSAPDPYSQSKAEEGRRIVLEEIAGRQVWRVVNGQYYRHLMSDDERRQRDAERKRASRVASADCPRMSANVRERPRASTNVRDVSHTDPDPDPDPGSPHSPPLGGTATTEADQDERITPCPLDLDSKLPPGLLDELADGYHVPRAAIERALAEFVAYWTLGPGTGKRRRNWPKQFRGRCHDLAKRGELVDSPTHAPKRAPPRSSHVKDPSPSEREYLRKIGVPI